MAINNKQSMRSNYINLEIEDESNIFLPPTLYLEADGLLNSITIVFLLSNPVVVLFTNKLKFSNF